MIKKTLIAALVLIPLTANAISVPWDRPAVGRINPLYILDTVYGNRFIATSTTQASIFPFASSTALSATTLCLSTDCRTVWPSGGGGFGQAWEIANGALSPTTTVGIGVYASSTIGNGTRAGGLTISGGATTTGLSTLSGGILAYASSTIGGGQPISGVTLNGTATSTGLLRILTVGGDGGGGSATNWPVISIGGDIATGWRRNAANQWQWVSQGSSWFTFAPGNFTLNSNANITLGTGAVTTQTLNGTSGAGLTITGGGGNNNITLTPSGSSGNLIVTKGNVGIGTSTPITTLNVYNASSTPATPQTTPFGWLISMLISGTYHLIETFDYYGHLITGGPTPSISLCGTSPSIAGNDRNWRVHAGSVLATSCTITFAYQYPRAPVCVVTQETGTAVSVIASSTPTTVVISGATFTDDWFVGHCEAYQ